MKRPVGVVALAAATAMLGLVACGPAENAPPSSVPPTGEATTSEARRPAQRERARRSTRGPRALAAAQARCTRFVAPYGSDDGDGTRERPWRTVQELARRIQPDDVACLDEGDYRGDLELRRGGAPGRPATIRSYPGRAARIVGRIWVTHEADHMRFLDVYLDGRNPGRLPSPTVNAANVSFIRTDVTNRHTGICFSLGSEEYGYALSPLIASSRIHDCGRLPATNHDHGVYLARTRSARILGNWIHDNADRGIQLYPDAQATTIRGNVIARNGQGIIFSGDETAVASGNLVERNVIADSLIRHNVESHYPEGVRPGEGNILTRNCVWGGTRDFGNGGVETPAIGFEPVENMRADPRFADPVAGDFRVLGGPCSELLGAPGDRAPGPASPITSR